MQDPDYVKGAFARIADRYVLTNHALSLGIDILYYLSVKLRVQTSAQKCLPTPLHVEFRKL